MIRGQLTIWIMEGDFYMSFNISYYNMILPNYIVNSNEDTDDNISSCNICDDKPADIFQIEGLLFRLLAKSNIS